VAGTTRRSCHKRGHDGACRGLLAESGAPLDVALGHGGSGAATEQGLDAAALLPAGRERTQRQLELQRSNPIGENSRSERCPSRDEFACLLEPAVQIGDGLRRDKAACARGPRQGFELRPPIAQRLERDAVRLAILSLIQVAALPRGAPARKPRSGAPTIVSLLPSRSSSIRKSMARTDRVRERWAAHRLIPDITGPFPAFADVFPDI